MRKIAVDTNAFLRYILNDIPEQKKAAEKLFTRAKEGKITLLVCDIVVFEIYFILSKQYGFSKEEVIGRIEPLVGADYFSFQNKALLHEALTIFKNNNISLADSFQLVYAKHKSAELFTFDKKLLGMK